MSGKVFMKLTGEGTSPEEAAHTLVRAVVTELQLGTKHYNQAGQLLETPQQIISCMIKEGGVTMDPLPERRHIFEAMCKSVEEVVEDARKDQS